MSFGKDQPRAPDPVQLANLQAAANRQGAQDTINLNAINTFTPQGSLTFGRDAGGNVTSRTEDFATPTQRATFAGQDQLASTLTGQANRLAGFTPTDRFDISTLGLPDIGRQIDFSGLEDIGDFSERRLAIEDASFNRFARFNEPEFARRDSQLRQSLADRGIVGQAADDEIARERLLQQGARADAQDRAVSAGATEESRLFGQGLQSRNQAINEQLQQFGVQGGARAQGLNEALTQRGQASNELAAALGLSPGVGFQQFQPTTQAAVNPTDVLGANALSQGVQQNVFNQQSALGRGVLGGLFNVGAAGFTGIGQAGGVKNFFS
jgi:hypothetical protein